LFRYSRSSAVCNFGDKRCLWERQSHLLTSIHHLVFEYIVVVVLIFWVRESR
jgi:hypothetical protein